MRRSVRRLSLSVASASKWVRVVVVLAKSWGHGACSSHPQTCSAVIWAMYGATLAHNSTLLHALPSARLPRSGSG